MAWFLMPEEKELFLHPLPVEVVSWGHPTLISTFMFHHISFVLKWINHVSTIYHNVGNFEVSVGPETRTKICVYIYIMFCCKSKERKKYFRIWRSTKRFVFVFRIYLFILFLHTCIVPACCFRQRTYMVWRSSSLFLRVCLL